MLDSFQAERARRAGWRRRFVPTGLAALDARLPRGGLPCGAVTEVLSPAAGAGALSFVMRVARRCQAQADEESAALGLRGGYIVLLDAEGDFYPPAARQHGLDLARLIVVRRVTPQQALWAADQALRCPAVAAVIGTGGAAERTASRRLQLAAEASGALGLFIRPAARSPDSFAAVRLLVERAADVTYAAPIRPREAWRPPPDRGGLCRITLLKAREGMPAGPLLVDLHHETGAVPVHPIPEHRPVAKTG